jgi:hypothetical protein
MSKNQFYLEDITVSAITDQVNIVLRENDFLLPPVNYPRIFDVQRLCCEQFTARDPEYKKFSSRLGEEKAAKLRGILLPSDKRVFVKNEGYIKRLNFICGHELGHWFLRWHRELLYECSEFDLSPSARKQLEKEANCFAVKLGFMNGLFNQELADLNLSINAIKTLSDRYDLSVESCLRTAIEGELRECALIVMEPQKHETGYVFKTLYSFQSTPFTNLVGGKILFQDIFESNHLMTQIMNGHNFTDTYKFESHLIKRDEQRINLVIDVWVNQYKAFALLVPKDVPQII